MDAITAMLARAARKTDAEMWTELPSAADEFVEAIATHRHFARETDPPRV